MFRTSSVAWKFYAQVQNSYTYPFNRRQRICGQEILLLISTASSYSVSSTGEDLARVCSLMNTGVSDATMFVCAPVPGVPPVLTAVVCVSPRGPSQPKKQDCCKKTILSALL